MDDLISRQAVIEINRSYHGQMPNEVNHRIWKEINELPSVQPDIIACGDCKHYIPHDKRCGYWNHGVKPLEWCSQAERKTDDER